MMPSQNKSLDIDTSLTTLLNENGRRTWLTNLFRNTEQKDTWCVRVSRARRNKNGNDIGILNELFMDGRKQLSLYLCETYLGTCTTASGVSVHRFALHVISNDGHTMTRYGSGSTRREAKKDAAYRMLDWFLNETNAISCDQDCEACTALVNNISTGVSTSQTNGFTDDKHTQGLFDTISSLANVALPGSGSLLRTGKGVVESLFSGQGAHKRSKSNQDQPTIPHNFSKIQLTQNQQMSLGDGPVDFNTLRLYKDKITPHHSDVFPSGLGTVSQINSVEGLFQYFQISTSLNYGDTLFVIEPSPVEGMEIPFPANGSYNDDAWPQSSVTPTTATVLTPLSNMAQHFENWSGDLTYSFYFATAKPHSFAWRLADIPDLTPAIYNANRAVYNQKIVNGDYKFQDFVVEEQTEFSYIRGWASPLAAARIWKSVTPARPVVSTGNAEPDQPYNVLTRYTYGLLVGVALTPLRSTGVTANTVDCCITLSGPNVEFGPLCQSKAYGVFNDQIAKETQGEDETSADASGQNEVTTETHTGNTVDESARGTSQDTTAPTPSTTQIERFSGLGRSVDTYETNRLVLFDIVKVNTGNKNGEVIKTWHFPQDLLKAVDGSPNTLKWLQYAYTHMNLTIVAKVNNPPFNGGYYLLSQRYYLPNFNSTNTTVTSAAQTIQMNTVKISMASANDAQLHIPYFNYSQLISTIDSQIVYPYYSTLILSCLLKLNAATGNSQEATIRLMAYFHDRDQPTAFYGQRDRVGLFQPIKETEGDEERTHVQDPTIVDRPHQPILGDLYGETFEDVKTLLRRPQLHAEVHVKGFYVTRFPYDPQKPTKTTPIHDFNNLSYTRGDLAHGNFETVGVWYPNKAITTPTSPDVFMIPDYHYVSAKGAGHGLRTGRTDIYAPGVSTNNNETCLWVSLPVNFSNLENNQQYGFQHVLPIIPELTTHDVIDGQLLQPVNIDLWQYRYSRNKPISLLSHLTQAYRFGRGSIRYYVEFASNEPVCVQYVHDPSNQPWRVPNVLVRDPKHAGSVSWQVQPQLGFPGSDNLTLPPQTLAVVASNDNDFYQDYSDKGLAHEVAHYVYNGVFNVEIPWYQVTSGLVNNLPSSDLTRHDYSAFQNGNLRMKFWWPGGVNGSTTLDIKIWRALGDDADLHIFQGFGPQPIRLASASAQGRSPLAKETQGDEEKPQDFQPSESTFPRKPLSLSTLLKPDFTTTNPIMIMDHIINDPSVDDSLRKRFIRAKAQYTSKKFQMFSLESLLFSQQTKESYTKVLEGANSATEKVNRLMDTAEKIVDKFSAFFSEENRDELARTGFSVLSSLIAIVFSDSILVKISSFTNLLMALRIIRWSNVTAFANFLTSCFGAKAQKETQGDEDLHEPRLLQWAKLLVPAILAAFGVTKAGSKGQDLISWLVKNLQFSNQFHLFVRNNLSTLVTLLKKIVAYFFPWYNVDEVRRASVELEDWLSRVDQVVSGHAEDIIMASNALKEKVADLKEEGKKYLLDVNFEGTKLRTVIATAHKKLDDLLRRIGQRVGDGMPHVNPICIWMEGPPGLGKSFLTAELGSHLCRIMGITFDGNFVFNRTLDQWWNGYCGQPVICFDDVGAFLTPEVATTFLKDWYGLLTDQPYNIPMPELAEKDRIAKPALIIANSNRVRFDANEVREPDAVHRRRHFVIAVRPSDEYLAIPGVRRGDPIDFSLLTPEQMTNYWHLKFAFYNDPVHAGDGAGPQAGHGQWLDWEEFLVNLAEKTLELRQRFVNSAKTRNDILNSLKPEKSLDLPPPLKEVLRGMNQKATQGDEEPCFGEDGSHSSNTLNVTEQNLRKVFLNPKAREHLGIELTQVEMELLTRMTDAGFLTTLNTDYDSTDEKWMNQWIEETRMENINLPLVPDLREFDSSWSKRSLQFKRLVITWLVSLKEKALGLVSNEKLAAVYDYFWWHRPEYEVVDMWKETENCAHMEWEQIISNKTYDGVIFLPDSRLYRLIHDDGSEVYCPVRNCGPACKVLNFQQSREWFMKFVYMPLMDREHHVEPAIPAEFKKILERRGTWWAPTNKANPRRKEGFWEQRVEQIFSPFMTAYRCAVEEDCFHFGAMTKEALTLPRKWLDHVQEGESYFSACFSAFSEWKKGLSDKYSTLEDKSAYRQPFIQVGQALLYLSVLFLQIYLQVRRAGKEATKLSAKMIHEYEDLEALMNAFEAEFGPSQELFEAIAQRTVEVCGACFWKFPRIFADLLDGETRRMRRVLAAKDKASQLSTSGDVKTVNKARNIAKLPKNMRLGKSTQMLADYDKVKPIWKNMFFIESAAYRMMGLGVRGCKALICKHFKLSVEHAIKEGDVSLRQTFSLRVDDKLGDITGQRQGFLIRHPDLSPSAHHFVRCIGTDDHSLWYKITPYYGETKGKACLDQGGKLWFKAVPSTEEASQTPWCRFRRNESNLSLMPWIEFRYDSLEWWDLGDFDVVMCKLPEARVPGFKDIRQLFLDEKKAKVTCGSFTLVEYNFSDGTPLAYGLPWTYDRSEVKEVLKHLGEDYEVTFTGWEYPISRKGLCGAILINDSTGFICGMHYAGGVGVGSAQVINREIFDDLVSEQDIETEDIIVGEGQPRLNLGDEITIGKVPQGYEVHINTRTAITKSLAHGLFENTRIPATLSEPTDVKPGYGPLRTGVLKQFNPSIQFPPKLVSEVKEFMRRELQAKAKPVVGGTQDLTLEEAVLGIPGVEYIAKMQLTTSSGWPYCATHNGASKQRFINVDLENRTVKLEAAFEAELARQHELRSKGCIPFAPFCDFLKDERLKPGKATRLINGCPMTTTIITRRYFGKFLAALRNSRFEHGNMVGINTHGPDWTRLADKLKRINRDGILCGDFSSFGPTLSQECVHNFIDVVNAWYTHHYGLDEKANLIRKTLVLDLIHALHVAGDTLYRTLQGSPSGGAFTAEINGFCRHQYTFIAYLVLVCGKHPEKSLCDVKDDLDVNSYGDDGIDAVTPAILPEFNNLTLEEFYSSYGYTYTDAAKDGTMLPHRSLETDDTSRGAQFLKCYFRKHPLRPGMYLGSIEESVALEICQWVRTSVKDPKSYLEASLLAAEQTCMAAHGLGISTFTEVRNTLQNFYADLGWPLHTRSWEQYDYLFFERGQWLGQSIKGLPSIDQRGGVARESDTASVQCEIGSSTPEEGAVGLLDYLSNERVVALCDDIVTKSLRNYTEQVPFGISGRQGLARSEECSPEGDELSTISLNSKF